MAEEDVAAAGGRNARGPHRATTRVPSLGRLRGSATRSSGRRQRQLLASKGATRRERAGLTPAGGRAPCARHPGFRGGKRPRPRPRARAAREPGPVTGEHGDTGTRTRWRCASWPSRGDPDTTGEAASLDLGSEDGREGRTDAGRTARSRPREETGRGVLTRSGAQPWRGAGPAAEGGRGDADSHCVSGSQPGGPGAAGTAAFPTPNTVSGARRRSARAEVSCPVLAPRGLRREPRRPLRPRSQWPFTCYSDKPVGTPCRSRGAGPAGSTAPATLQPPSQTPSEPLPSESP